MRRFRDEEESTAFRLGRAAEKFRDEEKSTVSRLGRTSEEVFGMNMTQQLLNNELWLVVSKESHVKKRVKSLPNFFVNIRTTEYTHISHFVMFGLHGGTPVHTGWHDIIVGGHACAEDQECDVQVEKVVHTKITLRTNYLFHLYDTLQHVH